MICRPGAFSQKYNTNPFPTRSSYFSKDRNKQNRNINSNTQSHEFNTAERQNQTMPERKSTNAKSNQRNQAKLKLEWEKYEKQLNSQVTKLKKQNFKLRQDIKKANKTNQQNICSYQAYIKEVEYERDQTMKINKMYEQDLKHCIIWMIEVFTLSQNQKNMKYLIQNKLSKTQMKDMFKGLAPTIKQLRLEQHFLKKYTPTHSQQQEQYLIYENQQRHSKGHCDDNMRYMQSQQQFNNLLDTFDLRKQSIKVEQQNQNIARRLFVNQDTFANDQIGDHSISHDMHIVSKNQQAFIKSNTKTSNNNNDNYGININFNFKSSSTYQAVKQKQDLTQALTGTTVKVNKNCENRSQDYIEVKQGDQIKLLRKVGQLWIAQHKNKIGFIAEQYFM